MRKRRNEMEYKEALDILCSNYVEYIPSAASWMAALVDLWHEHGEAFQEIIAVWHAKMLSRGDERCSTCIKFLQESPVPRPGEERDGWCGWGDSHYSTVGVRKGDWCPLWEAKK
jgi:hypothetical protein